MIVTKNKMVIPLLLLFVFLEEIYLKDKYESIFSYVQLHFILNIIMYYSSSYSLHSCFFFFETENFKDII